MPRHQLICLAALAALATLDGATRARRDAGFARVAEWRLEGRRMGVARGARMGRQLEMAPRHLRRRLGQLYPGQGFYPWGYPYGNAWPYAPRGSYGCYHPVQVPGLAKWNFVRESVEEIVFACQQVHFSGHALVVVCF